MMAADIHAQVTAWADSEIGAQAFGEDFALTVFCQAVPAVGPSGSVALPAWYLLITARNPVLGEGSLYYLDVIGDPAAMHLSVRPAEDTVRAKVTDGLRSLRELAAAKLSPANGGTGLRGLPGGRK